MKIKLLCSAAALMAGSFLAAHADPGTDITNAITALAAQPSYSWKTTVVVPADSRFKPGPTQGKTEKDGYTDVTASMRDNTIEFISKGDKIAVNTPDDGWESIADLQSDQGQGRMLAGMARNFKLPAAQAASVAAGAATLTKDGDVISGDLTEAGAKALLARGRGGRGGGGAPPVSDAKGTVKFWVTDGALTKFEFHLTGKVTYQGNERTMDTDTTVEISNVGGTKVTPPDEAVKILVPKPAADAAKA